MTGGPGPAATAHALPTWLPLLFLAALVVAFDPAWLDFEQARRGALLTLVGVIAVSCPAALALPAPGEQPLRLLLLWGLVVAAVHAGTAVGADSVLRLALLLSLLLTARLARSTGSAPWQRAAAPLLLLVAAVGILQACGVPGLHGTVLEPVSLFGNRNVAAEFVAVAGAATAIAFPGQRRLGALALCSAGAYAVANGSRSALVALPMALTYFAATSRGRPRCDRLGPLACVLLGAVAGWLLPTPLQAPPAAGEPTAAAAPARGATTLEVRLEIARAGLAMVGDAPVFGHGPGQFAVQYPRHRTQREIELSSLGRTEHRRVGTAHDDWLEVAIEGGLPALLLLLAAAWARWRAAGDDRASLAPLLALALQMFVRAPLGNAPTIALALLASGPAAAAAAVAPPHRRSALLLRIAGICMLTLGAAGLLAATRVARTLATAGASGPDPAAVERALATWPFDPAPWQLAASLRLATAASVADAERGLLAIDRALALRPFEPSYRLQRADLLRLAGRADEAKRELAEVARLDPGEPQVNLQLAGVFFTERDVDGAVAALSADPPPLLRRELAARFDEFAALAQRDRDAAAARRFVAEASFVRALDATGSGDAQARAVAAEHFETMRQAFAQAGLHSTDLREYVVLALRALDAGDPATAARAATAAGAGNRTLPAWQWPLLRPAAARLRAVEAWRSLLPAE